MIHQFVSSLCSKVLLFDALRLNDAELSKSLPNDFVISLMSADDRDISLFLRFLRASRQWKFNDT